MNDVETKSNRPKRNKDGDGDKHGIKLKLTYIEWIQAHRWILFHTDNVTPYLRKHLVVLRSNNPRVDDHQIQRIHLAASIPGLQNML
ncbi:hypothetical protein M0R45_019027 [Rubus argutus]|uniref:Uncharacterized protein n=1 Tax=Rubus argutus TaxID=59490 RepID=A0AAW1X4B8_RUBAR